jgi:hypothetical protein
MPPRKLPYLQSSRTQKGMQLFPSPHKQTLPLSVHLSSALPLALPLPLSSALPLEFVLSEPLSAHLSSALPLEFVLSEPLSVHRLPRSSLSFRRQCLGQQILQGKAVRYQRQYSAFWMSMCAHWYTPGMFDLGTTLTGHIPRCTGNNFAGNCCNTPRNCWDKPGSTVPR